MLSNFVLVWLYKYFDMSVTDESYVMKRASGVLNYKSGTFDNYLHHWVDATAGGRFVSEGTITSSVVSNINYVVIFINFLFTIL